MINWTKSIKFYGFAILIVMVLFILHLYIATGDCGITPVLSIGSLKIVFTFEFLLTLLNHLILFLYIKSLKKNILIVGFGIYFLTVFIVKLYFLSVLYEGTTYDSQIHYQLDYIRVAGTLIFTIIISTQNINLRIYGFVLMLICIAESLTYSGEIKNEKYFSLITPFSSVVLIYVYLTERKILKNNKTLEVVDF